ncbi:MAG: hypothetical protein OXI80_03160 [Caldilineaceae bacterium]|nr:hypothetical protein [Caldilineaceae bacterium]MDE0336645.1 hypothetical protein [Caldilineaceae bacterium]
MSNVKFASLIAALVIGCTSVSSAASYYLNSIYFTIWEPFVYPCQDSETSGNCLKYTDQPVPDGAQWYYAWPSIDPAHIHYQPQRSCVLDFLYHDPLPPGTLRSGQR